MWERFCFYGMRGMLTVFMVDELLLNEKVANLQYGATQAFVYAFTFIGGLFADKILGFRRSLFWGGLLMILGSIILAFDPKEYFFLGIGFNIVGTGFFKPNISTMVGQLYREGDARTDAGFSLFYAGINLGAWAGGYLCISIAQSSLFGWICPFHRLIPGELTWNVAFGLAAVVMLISLLTFTQTQKSLATIGLSPLLHLDQKKRRLYEWLTYAGSLAVIPLLMKMVSKTEYTDIFMFIVGPVSVAYLVYEMKNFDAQQNKKLIAALILIFFSIFFWAFFEQSGGSLSLFAKNNLDDKVLGVELNPNGVNNSANSIFVIAFAAFVGMIWLWLGKKNLEPNTIVKFGLGFIFLAGGFCLFYYCRFFTNEQGVTSLNIFTLGWLVATFGELCLSPIGMSILTKLSPQKLQAVIMGMWFLASAYGQYFAGLLGANIAEASENSSNYEKLMVYTQGYGQLALYSLIFGVVLIGISPLIRKLMAGVK